MFEAEIYVCDLLPDDEFKFLGKKRVVVGIRNNSFKGTTIVAYRDIESSNTLSVEIDSSAVLKILYNI